MINTLRGPEIERKFSFLSCISFLNIFWKEKRRFLSPAEGGCGKLGIGLARDGVVHGHLVGLARRDVPAVGLGEDQNAGAGIRPGLETGAAVPQLDRGADLVRIGVGKDIDRAGCRGAAEGQGIAGAERAELHSAGSCGEEQEKRGCQDTDTPFHENHLLCVVLSIITTKGGEFDARIFENFSFCRFFQINTLRHVQNVRFIQKTADREAHAAGLVQPDQ